MLLRERVAAARVARLATTDADGRPHLVPIVFVLDGDTLYSAVDRKPKRSRTLRRIENARARPDVTILVDRYDEDWTRLAWVLARGCARIIAASPAVLAALRDKYPQYRQMALEDAELIELQVERWTCWRASEPA